MKEENESSHKGYRGKKEKNSKSQCTHTAKETEVGCIVWSIARLFLNSPDGGKKTIEIQMNINNKFELEKRNPWY